MSLRNDFHRISIEFKNIFFCSKFQFDSNNSKIIIISQEQKFKTYRTQLFSIQNSLAGWLAAVKILRPINYSKRKNYNAGIREYKH